MRSTISLAIFVAASFAACAAVVRADDDDDEHHARREKRKAVAAVEDPTYRAECASCHMLYPPGLLPERSWKRMMDGLKDHFGENATLDAATKATITKFLVSHAADRSSARRSQKIAASIPDDEAPLRITETAYFRRQHHEVGKKVWQRQKVGGAANCAACHAGAEAGRFSEDEVRIPR